MREFLERTLGWPDRWPEGSVGRAGVLRTKLLAEGVRAASLATDLSPLDPMQVFVPAKCLW